MAQQSAQDAEFQPATSGPSGSQVSGADTQVVPENPTPVPDPIEIGSVRELFTDNLFKDAKNTVLTLVFGALVVWVLFKAFGFVFLNEKVGNDGELRSGWEVIREGPLVVYMVGNRFAGSGVSFLQLWSGIYVLAAAVGLGLGRPPEAETPPIKTRTRLGIVAPPLLGVVTVLSMTRTITPTLLVVGVLATGVAARAVAPTVWRATNGRLTPLIVVLSIAAYGLVVGGNPGAINNFGGLLLTVMVAASAILLSFPIGVVAALARRSSFPLIRPVAVAYIELIRGVPLITLLFMGQFAVGFFFPPGVVTPGPVARAILMFTLFTGAYVAEIVRGGLQSVPNGQVEAGQAVGLQPITITRRIVLPQALRTSIPALVGQFISVLKDTSLLVIIGQLDLLGVTDPILASLRFSNQGFSSETYAFVAFLFWIMCFSMSRASQRLETKLGVGRR